MRPLVIPHPFSFPPPGGGGGASLGQPKIFRCGSLCCCVGGCVVGHCHLYPLYSWQDILLTFAEMELDSTTMFPPGTSVMFIRSKNLLAPAKPSTKKAKPPLKSATQSIPVKSGKHVQEFKVKWTKTKKFYTELVKE